MQLWPVGGFKLPGGLHSMFVFQVVLDLWHRRDQKDTPRTFYIFNSLAWCGPGCERCNFSEFFFWMVNNFHHHGIHGTIVYLPTYLSDLFNGFHVGKYTLVPWILWDYSALLHPSNSSNCPRWCLGASCTIAGFSLATVPRNMFAMVDRSS